MAASFDISLEAGDAGAVLRIDLGVAHPGVRRLQVRTRNGSREHEVPVLASPSGLQAKLPLDVLLGEGVLRWDVRVEAGCSGGFAQLAATAATNGPRHFFQAAHAGHGISAYLSESASSLVLLSAPRQRHERIVELENTRAGFADLLRDLPVQDDLVIFESFLGNQYAGNPRYVYEALRRMRPDLRCVWAYNGSLPIPGDPQRVTRGSPEYYRVLAQARYRVNNVRFPVPGRKPETAYLQTWHGTPLKRLGWDIEVDGPEAAARESFQQESQGWSTLLSPNSYCSQTLRRAFRYDGPILEAGYPLTDPLLDPLLDRAAVAARLGLPANRSFILYAPTWRDHRALGAWRFDFDLNLDLQAVSAALAPGEMLLVKAHHLVSAGIDASSLPENVRDVSHLEDITELCALADVLVTDYSSVFFDFAATGRPILFYCYDLELYAREVRGFYLDVEHDLPGPIARDTGALLALLGDLPAVTKGYAARYEAFRKTYCGLADGRAARRVVEAVFGPAPGVPAGTSSGPEATSAWAA